MDDIDALLDSLEAQEAQRCVPERLCSRQEPACDSDDKAQKENESPLQLSPIPIINLDVEGKKFEVERSEKNPFSVPMSNEESAPVVEVAIASIPIPDDPYTPSSTSAASSSLQSTPVRAQKTSSTLLTEAVNVSTTLEPVCLCLLTENELLIYRLRYWKRHLRMTSQQRRQRKQKAMRIVLSKLLNQHRRQR